MDKISSWLAKVQQADTQGQYQLAIDMAKAGLQQSLTVNERWTLLVQLGTIQHALGDAAAALSAFGEALELPEIPIDHQRQLYSNYLFTLHYLPGISDDSMREAHAGYGKLFAGQVRYTHHSHHHKKCRVGYLSPDFNCQTNAFFIMQLLGCYDRSRYEVYCYALGRIEDVVTDQMKTLVDVWQNMAVWSDQAAAEQIYQDEIDILVDLSGHCAGGRTLRIAAYKPAPVQVTAIGWFDTTGLDAIDYMLGDVYCDPPQADDYFIEKIIRLPRSHLCYTPPSTVQYVVEREVDSQRIVYGSFNKFPKITQPMLGLWREILQRVPGSRLLLKSTSDSLAQLRFMKQQVQKAGLPLERLELRPASADYMDQYRDIDILLDTYPYPGGGTTCDALYMGVPVISIYGKRHGTRFGYSLLSNIGLSELATTDKREYVEKAVALGKDRELLATLQKKLRQWLRQSPVMNGPQYTKDVEAAYEMMWTEYLEKNQGSRSTDYE